MADQTNLPMTGTAFSSETPTSTTTVAGPKPDIRIYEDGDIYIIAKEGRDAGRMLVHSVILKSASKVFRAMFGPNFAEGQELNGTRTLDGIPERQLPDDHHVVLVQFLAALHHRTDLLKQTYPKALMYGIAVLASKYDCVEVWRSTALQRWPIEPQWPAWPDRELRADNLMYSLRALAAAHIFRMPSHFSIISNNIICSFSGLFRDLQNHTAINYLPDDILWDLNDARADLQRGLAEILGGLKGPRMKSKRLQVYTPYLPARQVSIRDMLNQSELNTDFYIDTDCSDLIKLCQKTELQWGSTSSDSCTYNIELDKYQR